MLKDLNLRCKVESDLYKTEMAQLSLSIAALQREAQNHKIPVIILLEGWEAAGKGTLISEVIQSLDPRGYRVFGRTEESVDEALRPYLWRYWRKLPEAGRIAFFDHSWYLRIMDDTFKNNSSTLDFATCVQETNAFERQLTDEGYLIIKFFVHISRKQQRKRFEKLEENPSTSWRVSREDWQQNKHYDDFLEQYQSAIEATDTAEAPWFIIEGTHKKYATLKMMRMIHNQLKSHIENLLSADKSEATTLQKRDVSSSVLDQIDLSQEVTKEDYKIELKSLQNRIRELEHLCYEARIPVVLLYEGWDAAGKGGNIRRLTQRLDPRGVDVIPIAAPTTIEKRHHYLWRFWAQFPKAGHLAIFDRSWYGRVLVERVEGFCSVKAWQRAYREINEMEYSWVNSGAVVLKFWLHIDQEEQLRRFNERVETPEKQWKITDEDWRNREKWEDYRTAVDDMLVKTSTSYAPWTVIESNNKYHARLKVLRTVVDHLEKRLLV